MKECSGKKMPLPVGRLEKCILRLLCFVYHTGLQLLINQVSILAERPNHNVDLLKKPGEISENRGPKLEPYIKGFVR